MSRGPRAGRAAGPAGASLPPALTSAVEPPPRRAVRLLAGDPEGGVEPEAVEVPGRRPGARRAVRGRECVALDLRRPPLRAVERSQPLQRRPVGDPRRLALEHEID